MIYAYKTQDIASCKTLINGLKFGKRMIDDELIN